MLLPFARYKEAGSANDLDAALLTVFYGESLIDYDYIQGMTVVDDPSLFVLIE